MVIPHSSCREREGRWSCRLQYAQPLSFLLSTETVWITVYRLGYSKINRKSICLTLLYFDYQIISMDTIAHPLEYVKPPLSFSAADFSPPIETARRNADMDRAGRAVFLLTPVC